MKHELKYAVVYDDGTWAGLFSSAHHAVKVASKRRNKKRGDPGCCGVFMIAKELTKAALPTGADPKEGT